MIRITVNGKTQDLEEEVSVSELLEKLELPTNRIAIELNKNVVSRRNWQTVSVGDKDELEIIHFVGGG
ncbi:MAG: sulfur carrier protein ThiS [Pyrinomonadaceae bacterium]